MSDGQTEACEDAGLAARLRIGPPRAFQATGSANWQTEPEGWGYQEVDMSDPVNHPPHYTHGGIECLDAIRAALTEEEFRGYIKGNCLKYLWRERHKNGDQDLQKAAFYLGRLT